MRSRYGKNRKGRGRPGRKKGKKVDLEALYNERLEKHKGLAESPRSSLADRESDKRAVVRSSHLAATEQYQGRDTHDGANGRQLRHSPGKKFVHAPTITARSPPLPLGHNRTFSKLLSGLNKGDRREQAGNATKVTNKEACGDSGRERRRDLLKRAFPSNGLECKLLKNGNKWAVLRNLTIVDEESRDPHPDPGDAAPSAVGSSNRSIQMPSTEERTLLEMRDSQSGEGPHPVGEAITRDGITEGALYDEGASQDQTSRRVSFAGAPLLNASGCCGSLQLPGIPSAVAPLDFFWTFEVEPSKEELERILALRRTSDSAGKRETSTWRCSADLGCEAGSKGGILRGKETADQFGTPVLSEEPSAVCLLLQEEPGRNKAHGERSSSPRLRDEPKRRKKQCSNQVSGRRIGVHPRGYTSYNDVLPLHAAKPPCIFSGAECLPIKACAHNRDTTKQEPEGCAIGTTTDCHSRSTSAEPGGCSYFEHVLQSVPPEAPFSPSPTDSPYGFPPSMLLRLQKLLRQRSSCSGAPSCDCTSPSDSVLHQSLTTLKARALFHYLSTYVDVTFPHQNHTTSTEVRFLYSLHVALHIWKARRRVQANSNLVRRITNKDPQELRVSLVKAPTQHDNAEKTVADFSALASPGALKDCEGGAVHEDVEEEEQKGAAAEQRDGCCRLIADGQNEFDGVGTCAGRDRGRRTLALQTHCQLQGRHAATCQEVREHWPGDWLESQVRDGGYTRPRVLVLLPFRSAAKQVVDNLIAFMPDIQQVLNKRRYEEEFGLSCREEEEQKQNFCKGNKPEDFVDVFGGNDDDQFRLGIRVANKSLVMYAPFYSSDILVASPLGLRMVVGTAGDAKRDYDFLSSIEVVIVDRADVIGMQNWAFLKDCFAALNLPPLSYTSFDIRRLRPSVAAGVAASFRQTIICSNGRDARIHGLLKQFCWNRRGQLHLFDAPRAAFVPNTVAFDNSEEKKPFCREGMLELDSSPENFWGEGNSRIGRNVASKCAAAGVQQLFCKVACPEFSKISGCIIQHFVTNVLPSLGGEFSKAVVVLSSYLDYCRLWRFLKEHGIDFVSCHEYTSNGSITRSRQRFHKGEVSLLITTVRFLFYRRYSLRGADRILFLEPPVSAEVYTHVLLHSLPDETDFGAKHTKTQGEDEGGSSIRKCGASICFFTKYHVYQLERLLGVDKAVSLLQVPDRKVVAIR